MHGNCPPNGLTVMSKGRSENSLQKQVGCFNHRAGNYPGCRQVEETVVIYYIFCLSLWASMAAHMVTPFTMGLHDSSYGYISTFTSWCSAADEDGYWPKHVLHSGLASSLIPRPSHHPFFDCLQCAKTKR